MSKKQTAEFSKAASRLACTDVFFVSLLYNLNIVPRYDLEAAAGTDGATLYYHPDRFRDEFDNNGRVFVLVHEILHVILFHNLRRGIRDPRLWNIACDHVVNLLCLEYGHNTAKKYYCDSKYAGMTAEKVYDLLLQEEDKQPSSGKGSGNGDGKPMPGSLGGDVMDYDPSQNEGKSKADVEREIAIGTEKAAQAAKAAGKFSAGLKRIIGDAQVTREAWYSHLRRYLTSLHSRQYSWSRIDARRAALFGVVSPQQKTEQMGKVVFWIDCSGSITDRQLSAMGKHISDILKDVTPSQVVVGYFDAKVCHVDEFTGPDYNVTLEGHGGGGTCFEPMFEYMQEHHTDAQVTIVFTDLFGSFPAEGNPVCDTLWVSQTENKPVPFGELIYGDLNEG